MKILLVDDHAVLRAGLRALLDSEPGLEVVGEAEDGRRGLLPGGPARRSWLAKMGAFREDR